MPGPHRVGTGDATGWDRPSGRGWRAEPSPTRTPSRVGSVSAVRVVILGATGYIGGRLVPELLARGHDVVCGARSPGKLDGRPWRDQVEVAEVDVFDPASLRTALEGADAVHYLVHSMDGQGDFARRDRQAAANVRDAAAAAGVGRIVYLGGLGSESDDLSAHLRSRHEVGRVLADGPTPVTEFRAAIIIGSGSASFEMLRHLVEVLPAMTTPRWVSTRVQPISVRDVLWYLCACLEVEDTAGRVLEIGGPDVLTYIELMHAYAEVAGLRRRIIVPVPVLSPGLSSLWIGLVTPLPTGLARPLVDSLVNEVVVTDHTVDELLPHPTDAFRTAVERALERVQDLDVATTWASADRHRRPAAPEDPQPDDPEWSGGTVFAERQQRRVDASAGRVWAAVCAATLGRPTAAVGDEAGRWSVREVEPGHRLVAHLDVGGPGELWVTWEVTDVGPGTADLAQEVRFAPHGLAGRVSWLAAAPVRGAVSFAAVQRRAAAAERAAARPA